MAPAGRDEQGEQSQLVELRAGVWLMSLKHHTVVLFAFSVGIGRAEMLEGGRPKKKGQQV